MVGVVGLIGLLACVDTAFAQPAARRDREDQNLAIQTRLPISDIRAIRLAAGIADDAVGVRVSQIDALTLKQRKQILLVENQSQCIRLHVIERGKSGFKEIWYRSGLRDLGWKMEEIDAHPGPGICSQAPRAPSVRATDAGRIVVEIPMLSDAFQRTPTAETYTFNVWSDKTTGP
jgi:hypothetical protein